MAVLESQRREDVSKSSKVADVLLYLTVSCEWAVSQLFVSTLDDGVTGSMISGRHPSHAMVRAVDLWASSQLSSTFIPSIFKMELKRCCRAWCYASTLKKHSEDINTSIIFHIPGNILGENSMVRTRSTVPSLLNLDRHSYLSSLLLVQCFRTFILFSVLCLLLLTCVYRV